MKKSELNLEVINNFILHITHSTEGDFYANDNLKLTANEFYQMARDYIEENHINGVDGDKNSI
jgi:hypothetical protein